MSVCVDGVEGDDYMECCKLCCMAIDVESVEGPGQAAPACCLLLQFSDALLSCTGELWLHSVMQACTMYAKGVARACTTEGDCMPHGTGSSHRTVLWVLWTSGARGSV